MPDISIVTPCLNRVDHIETAIKSVLRQEVGSCEHIIVDGGSTDGTLDIIKKYPHIKYISEKDENLYQALNKGIRMAKGRVIGHLNSDDAYPENTFIPVLDKFDSDDSLETVYGNVDIFEIIADQKTLANHYENTELSLANITIGVASTNARFFSKKAYDRIGLYSEKYSIASDRDFLLRAAFAELKSVKISQTVYEYLSHSGSLTISNTGSLTEKVANEYVDIAESYLKENRGTDVDKWLKKWIVQTSRTMLITSLKNLDLDSIRFYFLKGMKTNQFFPFTLVIHIFIGKLQRFVNFTKNKA